MYPTYWVTDFSHYNAPWLITSQQPTLIEIKEWIEAFNNDDYKLVIENSDDQWLCVWSEKLKEDIVIQNLKSGVIQQPNLPQVNDARLIG